MPGASVAGVALAHGVNANIVHRWLRERAGQPPPVAPSGFVALSLPSGKGMSVQRDDDPARPHPDIRRKSRYPDDQIIGFIKQAEAGIPIKELCRKGGFSDATFYKWRAKFGGMDVPDARQLRSWKVKTPSSSVCWPKPTWTSMRSIPPSG